MADITVKVQRSLLTQHDRIQAIKTHSIFAVANDSTAMWLRSGSESACCIKTFLPKRDICERTEAHINILVADLCLEHKHESASRI